MKRSLAVLSLAFAFAVADAQKRPVRQYDLQDVAWHLSFDETKGEIYGDVTNTLRPLSTTESVNFHCGNLKVAQVTINGVAATFDNDGKTLTVKSAQPMEAGKDVAVRILYSGKPTAGIYFVPAERAFPASTNVVYTQGEMIDNRYWLPTYDWPDDKATSEAWITVKKGEYALSNGALIDRKVEGDKETFHWKLSQPVATYLISLVAGPYDEGRDAGAKIPTYWYVPKGLAKWGEAAFGKTSDIVDFYGSLTGLTYPYPKFSQAAVPDFMFGGMENTTAVTQTIRAIYPPEAAPLEDATGLVAHELAHQWFGDTVTCDDWTNIWINEGFATFLPHFWTRQKSGQEAYDIQRVDTLDGAWGASRGGRRPVVSDRYEEPIDLFDGIVYGGGAARMFMLMNELGEETFWKGIAGFLNKHKFENVTTDMFFDDMSAAAGKDLTRFKKQWFYTDDAPEVTVSRKNGNVVINLATPGFMIDTSVWVLDGSHSWVKKPVTLTQGENVIELGGLRTRPLLVDPESRLMLKINYDLGYNGADWGDLYNNAPNAGTKRRILNTAYVGLAPARKFLFIEEERNSTLRAWMLRNYGRGNSMDLLEMAGSPDPVLRNAAMEVIGNQDKSEEVLIARLEEAWTTEKHPVIRHTIFKSLLQVKGNPDLADKGWHLDHHRDSYRMDSLWFWKGKDPNKARLMALEALAGKSSEPLRMYALEVLGELKDLPGQKDAFNAIVKVVQGTSFEARTAAVNALASYGGSEALAGLKAMPHQDLHYMRRTIQRAIDRASKG